MRKIVLASCLAFAATILLVLLAPNHNVNPRMLQVVPTATSRSTPATRQAYNVAMDEWSSGHQYEAEALLAYDVHIYPSDQQLAFFHAACERSRWDIIGAGPLLQRVVLLQPGTADALCATFVSNIDAGSDIFDNFNGLTTLAKSNPSDLLILWMLAVECRQLERDYARTGSAASAANFGIQCYSVLLSRTNGVGPSLVHQTYGNLLDDMGQTSSAVVQRRLAAEQEPARWSCPPLIQDLDKLGLNTEAAQDRIKYAAFL